MITITIDAGGLWFMGLVFAMGCITVAHIIEWLSK